MDGKSKPDEMRVEVTIGKLKELLSKHSAPPQIDPNQIEVNAPVFGPSGVLFDSLAILDAIVEIEKEFAISIPDEDLTESLFASVQALGQYIYTHSGACDV